MPFISPFMGYRAPGMLYPVGNPFFVTGPGMVSMPIRSSLPSSPPTTDCMIAEFCEKYNLGEWVEIGLNKLGFHFRDDLNTVTAEEYMEAGFKPLEWRWLLKAYRWLKHDNYS